MTKKTTDEDSILAMYNAGGATLHFPSARRRAGGKCLREGSGVPAQL